MPGLRLARVPHRRPLATALAGLLLCLLGVQLILVAHRDSANWDEAHHLYDGYLILTQHDFRANAEVPPLVKVVAALPILHLHPILPRRTGNAFLDGRAFVFGNGGDRLLFPARLACILFSLLTGLLLFLATRHFFGSLAALCALLLFVFDPLVLAHGSLISTDMASACFLFATVYAFFRFAEHRSPLWFLATGLLAGLAMVSKYTGILAAPMLLAIALVEGIRQRSLATFGRLLAASLAALTCAWLVIWIAYGFRYAPAPPGLELHPALAPYLASLPNPADGAKLALVARFHLLPQAYIWGLANTKHTEWEYTSYFLGRVYRHGPWQYFPLAFLIKSTLPLLLLLLLTPIVWYRSRTPYPRELVFFFTPVAVYFAVITSSHFDIGARHLMPVYPFLYLIAGATAAMLLRSGTPWTIAAVVLLFWQVVTSLRVAPDYMAYGNEAFGGPLHVRQYLSDANVDWGQQLKSVRAYLQQNGISDCWFGYFPDGAVQPADYGIPCHRLPTPSALWWLNLPMSVPPEIHGTVLLSESVLDGVESGDGVLNPYNSFRTLHPVAILQDGVYVYRGDFPVPLASAWVDTQHSIDESKAGHLDQALTLAQQAVTLAPDSPRTQLQLAEVLSQTNQLPAARTHFLLAQQALARQRPDLQAEALGPPITAGLARTTPHTP